jgi:hypothetical protein
MKHLLRPRGNMLRIILRLKAAGERHYRAEHDKQAATSFSWMERCCESLVDENRRGC